MTLDEIIRRLSTIDNANDQENWFKLHKREIVDEIIAQNDHRKIKVAIDDISSAFVHGKKRSMKDKLKVSVDGRKDDLLKERTQNLFTEEVALVRDHNGAIVSTQENIVRLLLACNRLNLRYDEFTDSIYYQIDQELPWNSDMPKDYISVSGMRFYNAKSEYQLSALKKFLLQWFPNERNWTALNDSLVYAGRQNHFNLYQHWMDNVVPEWDHVDRMHFLHDYAGIENKAWASVIGHSIFMPMIARCYEPGFDFRGLPILEGPQNSGKTRLCRLLAFDAQFFHQLFFTRNMEGYEPSRQLVGKAVVELPELGGIKNKDLNYMKHFLSSLVDTNRRMHGNFSEHIARTFILIATTNEMGRYFWDTTGNTRYLPARLLAEIINLDAIAMILPQLYAQAKFLWDTGRMDLFRLNEHEYKMQNVMTTERELRPDYFYYVLEQLKLHQAQMIYDQNENWDDGFLMEEMLSWMQTEPWFASKPRHKHQQAIADVVRRSFHFELKSKRVPPIRRKLNDPEFTKKFRYEGKVPFAEFISKIDEE